MQSHRVLAIDRRCVDQGGNWYWTVWVDYLESSSERPTDTAVSRSKPRIDYKDVLSPEDFEVFAQLRTLRKEMAGEDGVALYRVFTNEQLAQIVQSRVRTQDDLRQIGGIGDARLEKYGSRVVDLLNKLWKDSDEEGGETAESDH